MIIPKPILFTLEEEETFEDFSESLASEVSQVNTCTYPSTPSTFIDLPECNSIKGEFFYNYYTKDERTVDTSDVTTIEVGSPDQSVEFLKKQSKAPMSVILTISAPTISPETDKHTPSALKSIAQSQGKNYVRNFQDEIVFEGAVANTRFSSLILKDNRVDETFYRELTNSFAFNESYSKSDNQSQLAAELARTFDSPMAGASQQASTIKKALSNMQPRGTAYAPTDARYQVIAEALRDVYFVEFNMTLGNAVAGNVILGSLEDGANIYQDELMSVESDAIDIQRKYVKESRGFEISSSEFDIELAPIEVLSVEEYPGINEGAVPIGFYIEKREITQDPEDITKSITRDLQPIIVDSYGPLKIFDTNVKYGGTYVYTVKIIYLVAYEANAVDPDNLTPDETIFALSLIASEGIKHQVACLERIPPPPPRNLRFNYNFFDNCLDLFWEEPSNPQRDVMRYQVFRRASLREPFTLVGELDFDYSTSRVVPLEKAPANKKFRVSGPRSIFKDTKFKRSDRFIYALASVDARGLTSGYSEQIEVSFDRYENKLRKRWISEPNAPKPYPNLYLNNDFFVDTISSSGASRVRIFFDPEYSELLKSQSTSPESSSDTKSKGTTSGKSRTQKARTSTLNLIGSEYRLQIINLDLQNSETFKIFINDFSGPVQPVPLGQAQIQSVL